MEIVALDPGGTTGIAHVLFNSKQDNFGHIYRKEFGDGEDHHKELYKFLIDLQPNVIVCERFTHQNRKNEDAAGGVGAIGLESNEYIGVAKLFAQMKDIKVVLQTPSDAKKTWTDKKLKALDLWLTSSPHAMDATRHLLLFIEKNLGKDNYVRQLRKVS